ncbi:MAG: YlbF family regulator [Lachnotalea sp.]
MNNVKQCTDHLVEAIVQSEEYKAYNEAKEALSGNIELCLKLNEFRERNFKMQSSSDGEDLFDELDLFEQEYADFRKDAKVNAFLAAELRMCRITQEVNASIANVIDLELIF